MNHQLSDSCAQVESIVGRKEEKGEVLYKVHWKGYSNKNDSWEPEKNLQECEDLIEAFLKKSPQV